MAHLQTSYVCHAQRVIRFYKKACRTIDSMFYLKMERRKKQVEMRAIFDKYKNLEDLEQATALLERGMVIRERYPESSEKRFTFSVGGTPYGRESHFPDILYDEWHPLEKAMFPNYFAKRDIAKEKHIEWWHKKYGAKVIE